MVQVYLDKEANKIVSQLREEDENFNFSGWIKEQLIKFNDKDKEDDIVELSKQLEEIKIKELQLKNEEEYTRERIARVKVRDEEKRIEQKENLSVQELREQARAKTFMEFAPSFIDLEKDILKTLAFEFKKLDVDVRTFLSEKGYLDNDEEVEDVTQGKIIIKEQQAQEVMENFIDKARSSK